MFGLRPAKWYVTVLLVSVVILPVGENSAAERENKEFEALIDEYLGIFHGVGQARSVNDGSKEYFRRVDSEAGRLLSDLEAIKRNSLTFAQDIDYRFLGGLLRSKINDGENVPRWKQDPRVYLDLEPIISPRGGLLHDELRLPEDRTDEILAAMASIPARLENAMQNLEVHVPLWHENSIEVLQGNMEIVEYDVRLFAERVPRSRDAVLAAADRASRSYAEFERYLREEWPLKPAADWRIGTEVFDHRIRHLHLIEGLTAEQFYDWGRREYQDQLHVLEELAEVVDPERTWQQIELDLQKIHPSEENMIEEHRKAVQRTRPWVEDTGLFSIPFDTDNQAIAAAAPAVYGRRQWYGFGGAPRGAGLSDPGRWSLVPADPRWSPERREEFLRGHNYAMINTMVNHEVYPGHGLIQLFLNQNPRKLRTYESSYANQAFCYYIEWDLVPNHGFYPPEMQELYQIEKERNKLWRYARVIYDAGMHTGKVTVDEAVNIMHEGVIFAERFAFIEVEYTTRGGSTTAIPTWGYHEFLQLRDDYFSFMAARDRKGTLRDFHDRVLRIGMLPVSLIRETLFHELTEEIGD